MFTKTRLRQILRANGCLRPRDHLKGCEEAGKLLRCYQAHPPMMVDEVAGRDMSHEQWFSKVPVRTRRLMRSWEMTGRNGHVRVTGSEPIFSPRVAEGVKEFTYASTLAVMRADADEKMRRGL